MFDLLIRYISNDDDDEVQFTHRGTHPTLEAAKKIAQAQMKRLEDCDPKALIIDTDTDQIVLVGTPISVQAKWVFKKP